MNDKELKEYLTKMEEFREQLKHDKKLSLELLVKAGICNDKGELTEIYK